MPFDVVMIVFFFMNIVTAAQRSSDLISLEGWLVWMFFAIGT
jgi:hypothetical protein